MLEPVIRVATGLLDRDHLWPFGDEVLDPSHVHPGTDGDLLSRRSGLLRPDHAADERPLRFFERGPCVVENGFLALDQVEQTLPVFLFGGDR